MVASQGKAAARSAEEAVRPQPQRYRMNVPAADESVMTWMAVQDNHSLSMRMLIRESIERNGYIDVMNKPVEQLPKRGRPIASDDVAIEQLPEREPQLPAVPVTDLMPAAAAAVPAAASADLDLTPDPVAAPELLGIALESPAQPQPPAPQPVAPPAPAAAPSNPEPSSSGHMEVNDIFSTLR